MNESSEKETGRSTGRLRRWVQDEHAVGLDVHNGQITASHFSMHSNRLRLDAFAQKAYDPALTDKELARCIRVFWKKNKFPTRTVCTNLHSPSIITRFFLYTNVLPDELQRVLSVEAEETLQLPLDQISLSWRLNPANAGNRKEISGTLVAAPRKTVRNHIKLIQSAGLYPVNVETDGFAVINLYDFIQDSTEPAPTCLVNLTGDMADIMISANGAIYPRVIFSGSKTGWQDNLEYLIENIESALLHQQLTTRGTPVSRLLLTGTPLNSATMEQIATDLSLSVEKWEPDETLVRLLHSKSIALPREVGTSNPATSLGLGLRYPKGGRDR